MAEAEPPTVPLLRKEIDALEVRTLLSGEYDEREAIVQLSAGAGGVDAADWTEMLLRMYLRWAERHGWQTEVLDTIRRRGGRAEERDVPGEGAVRLRHAAQRARRAPARADQPVRQPGPPADVVRRGRGHARSSKSSDHVDIDEKDLRIDIFRSLRAGRAGGQHDRLGGADHPPPDRTSSSPARTSAVQLQNKASAMTVLAGKLLERRRPEEAAERAAAHRRPAGRQLRLADPQLRAAPVPDGQGPAHRRGDRQHRRACWTATSTRSSTPRSGGAGRPRWPLPPRDCRRLVTAAGL